MSKAEQDDPILTTRPSEFGFTGKNNGRLDNRKMQKKSAKAGAVIINDIILQLKADYNSTEMFLQHLDTTSGDYLTAGLNESPMSKDEAQLLENIESELYETIDETGFAVGLLNTFSNRLRTLKSSQKTVEESSLETLQVVEQVLRNVFLETPLVKTVGILGSTEQHFVPLPMDVPRPCLKYSKQHYNHDLKPLHNHMSARDPLKSF
jgi:hypothetical protein